MTLIQMSLAFESEPNVLAEEVVVVVVYVTLKSTSTLPSPSTSPATGALNAVSVALARVP